MISGFSFFLLILPVCFGIYLITTSQRRNANEVLSDLRDPSEISGLLSAPGQPGGEGEGAKVVREKPGSNYSDELGRAGLVKPDERKQFLLRNTLMMPGVSFCLVAAGIFAGEGRPLALTLFAVLGLCTGFFAGRIRLRRLTDRHRSDIEFFLPLVMERIVMAVEAGLDILPALDVVTRLDWSKDSDSLKGKEKIRLDPVSELLFLVSKLVESGSGFERALREVSQLSSSSALRHAFVHLGLAQKEGGELIMPLRELSDATQAYYQETIEERIATMPAKATLPLLCAFSGLIICFLTPAMMEVISIMERSLPG